MKIICKKDILISNINIVAKAVSSKSTLDILECILLVADTKGFRLIANDLEIGIETSNIEAELEETGAVALEAKIFSEIIRNLPEEDVIIEADDKNVTLIKSGKTEFKILGRNAEEFPRLAEVERENKYSIKPVTFKNMVRQTVFSVSLDESKPVLTGELLEIKDESFNMVSIDGFRVSFRKTDIDPSYEETSVVVPAKALSEISKILTDKEDATFNIYFTDNQILFELDSCVMIARLLEGDFIKYEQIFTDDYTTKIEIDKLQLLRCLERASLISKDNKKTPVKIKIEQDGNVIITSNTDISNSYDEIKAEIEGKELTIAFNPKYLIDALKAIEDSVISIQFMTELSPCIIKGITDDSYKYLILPLKLKDNE